MRVYSLLYVRANNLKAYIDANRLDAAGKYLVIVHTDKLLKGETASLVENISGFLPNAEIVGCSVGGIIYRGESLKDKTLVSIIELSDAEVKTASVCFKDGAAFKSPERLAAEVLRELDGASDCFLFAYYSPTYPFTSRFVRR